MSISAKTLLALWEKKIKEEQERSLHEAAQLSARKRQSVRESPLPSQTTTPRQLDEHSNNEVKDENTSPTENSEQQQQLHSNTNNTTQEINEIVQEDVVEPVTLQEDVSQVHVDEQNEETNDIPTAENSRDVNSTDNEVKKEDVTTSDDTPEEIVNTLQESDDRTSIVNNENIDENDNNDKKEESNELMSTDNYSEEGTNVANNESALLESNVADVVVVKREEEREDDEITLKVDVPSLQLDQLQEDSTKIDVASSRTNRSNSALLSADRKRSNDHSADDSFTTDDELSTNDSTMTPRDGFTTPRMQDDDSDLSSSSSTSGKPGKQPNSARTKKSILLSLLRRSSINLPTQNINNNNNESGQLDDKLKTPRSLADLDITIEEIIEEDLVGGAGFQFQIGTAFDKQREYYNMINVGRHLSLADNIKGLNRGLVSEQLQNAKLMVKSRLPSHNEIVATTVTVLRPHEYEDNAQYLLDSKEINFDFSNDDEEWDCVYVNGELMEHTVEFDNRLHEPEVAFLNGLYEEEVIHVNPLFEPLTHSIYSTSNIEHEESVLIEAMKKDIKRRDKRVSAFIVKKQVFSGAELVNWIQRRANFQMVREDCVFFAQQLMDRHVFKCSRMTDTKFIDSSSVYYRFVEEYTSPECLNVQLEQYGVYMPPPTNGTILRKVTNLLERIVNDFQDRKNENDRADKLITIHTFDYRAFSESETYIQMKEDLSSPLHKLDPSTLTDNQRKAFFINIYNLFTLHALIVCGRPTNTIHRQQFFKLTKYVIGRYKLSLDNIYHGILRGSLYRSATGENFGYKGSYKSGANGVIASRSFSNSHLSNTEGIAGKLNIRLFSANSFHERVTDELHVKPFDPRIHFALYQGNLTSPKLIAFKEDEVNEQLEEAAREYINNNTKVDFKNNIITLSKLFEWYQQDFANDEQGVLEYVMKYLDVEKRGRLSYVLKEHADSFKIEYHYDWLLNNRMNAQDKQSENSEVRIELDEVRNDSAYRHFFMSFCEIEHSTENLEFWIEVQKFKKIKDPLKQIRAAKRIEKTFLGPTSIKEINVSRNLIRSVESQIAKAASQTKIKARETPRTPSLTETDGEAPVTTEVPASAPPKKKRKELLLPTTLFDKLEEEMESVMTDTFSRFKQHALYDEMIRVCVTDFIMDNLAVTLEGDDVGEVDFFEALKAQQEQEEERSTLTETIIEKERTRNKTMYSRDPLRFIKSVIKKPEDVTMSDQEFLQRRRESIEKKRKTRKALASAELSSGNPLNSKSLRLLTEDSLLPTFGESDSFIIGATRGNPHNSM